ncbi:MAG: aminotransferase class I/II-fold pyridoxal phosphate-dependent enzyme, partial [Thermodesulfobacteriota bacterium]|nr:aminotransferase class I/II-fold pyridoxal phosphate-dependent enzyme [Thermodesulfobacteriota bacterium]
SRDLIPPIHMTSTYRFKNAEHGSKLFLGKGEGYIYTRVSNPTVDMLQEKMATLEGGRAAIATASGMSAIVSTILTLARPGDNFAACNSLYGGTFALFNKDLRRLEINPHFISPASGNSRQAVRGLVDNKTRFMYLETPANPTMDVIDISMWASIARERKIPLIVDNTFASPYLQKPLSLGAEIVVHSATKYLGGHGDIIGGIIVGSPKAMSQIKEGCIKHFGPIMSPFNAWLILRGLKTLALRMNQHSDSALKVAQWMEGQKIVKKVHYPGLESHGGHGLAKRQMKKFGGMIAFEVKGGVSAVRRILNNLAVCTLAVSLGDCETLMQHPASMTHSTYTKKERAKAGIRDGLIRLSMGLEHPDDIIADLENAFSLSQRRSRRKKGTS